MKKLKKLVIGTSVGIMTVLVIDRVIGYNQDHIEGLIGRKLTSTETDIYMGLSAIAMAAITKKVVKEVNKD